MAVNKNFVVKNGLEVNTNLLVADLDTQTVGIGTTIAPHELHVVGGIGVTNLNVTGVATIANLRIGGISTFVGFTTFLGDINVGGASTFKGLVDINGGGQADTFKVEDLTNNRVVIAGTGGELEDDGNFTFTGNQLTLGVGATVGGGLTASSVMVEDLTNNRVVIAGTDGELEDSSNFVFDGSQLILGVGATVGGALTVAGATDLNSTLDVSGEANFSSGVGIADSIFHIGDDNTQIRFPANDTFAVETNGVEAFRVTGDRRIGIGTADPTRQLEVFDSTNAIINLKSNTQSSVIFSDPADINPGMLIYEHSSDSMQFRVNDAERARITSAGDVGIGTTNPTGNNAVDAANEAVLAVGIATAYKVFSDSLEVGAKQVISSARQLQNIASLDSTTTATIESAIANAPNTFTDIEVTGIATFKSTVKVEDLAPNRVVFVGAGDSLTDDANFTFDRSQLILGVGATVGGALTVAGASDLNGALDVNGEVTVSPNTAGKNTITLSTNAANDGRILIKSDTTNKVDIQSNGVSFFDGGQVEFRDAGGVGIADSIYHISDDNTQIRFPAADTFTVETGGSEALRVDSSQRLLVGNTSPRSNAPGADVGFQIEGASGGPTNKRFTQHIFGSGDGSGPYLGLAKHRGTSVGGNTIVVDDDELGGIYFQGADGANFKQGASILGFVDGTPGSNDMPGRLVFNTTADGASSPTERLRITSAGLVGINENNPGHFIDMNIGTTNIGMKMTSTDPGAYIQFVDNTTSSENSIGALGDNLQFKTDGSERVRITSTGSVGIGTTNPQAKLVVSDGSNGLEFNANSKNAVVSYNRVTSAYGPVGLQGSTIQLRIGGVGTALSITPAGDVDFKGNNGITSMSFDRSSNSLDFVDNAKAQFGAGDDLQIYHNGSNSYITDAGTGYLIVQSNRFEVTNAAGNESIINAVEDGAVELYHNNSKRFETTADGADLSGTGSIKIPVGTTAQRNGSPVNGDIRYNTTLDSYEGYGNGAWGGLGGGTEIDTTVSTVNPTGVGSFATASFRSASVITQINQLNTDFQVGRYLMIHDGTTVTVIEESAVSTGSTMLGSFTGVIDGSNVELRVTLASAGVSTITTKIDTVTV